MPKIRQPASKLSTQYWLLALFIGILFVTGGASRTDVQSLAILRPLSIIFCAIAIVTLGCEHLAGRGWLFASVIGTFLLVLLHVIPLPPAVWRSFTGTQELINVEKITELKDVWRPLTFVPLAGWQAALSLFTPLAIILLAVQFRRNELFRLLPLLILISALSGLVGLLQAIGDPKGPLYFYRLTNNGSAVGFFANRNHGATLLACLFPMLATFASTAKGTAEEVRFRQILAAAVAIVVIPLILITGSRSGLVSSFIGLSGAALLYNRPAQGREIRRGTTDRIKMIPILSGLVVLCMVFITFFFSRAKAVERLFDDVSGEGARIDFWLVSVDLFFKYFPWGSRSGSYAEAFQIIEPSRFLDPTYLNRAHNDWIEIAVTFGLPGIIALTIATTAFIWRSSQLWRVRRDKSVSVMFGRMSSIIILILAIASISDYPLRTPILMGLLAIFLLWFTEAARNDASFTGQDA